MIKRYCHTPFIAVQFQSELTLSNTLLFLKVSNLKQVVFNTEIGIKCQLQITYG
jgi:hypothetical protein